MADYTIVVEWDNPRLYRETRQEADALSIIVSQMRSNPRSGELIVVFDRQDANRSEIETILGPVLEGVEWAIVETDGLSYYRQKNEGVRHAKGDLVLFLDSDCLPSDGALNRLLDAFDDQAVDVVCGNTIIDRKDLWHRSWVFCAPFPIRHEAADRVREVTGFFANNVAFRRKVAVRFPFPEHQNSLRGQCVELARTLRSNGIPIWRHDGIVTRHPAPEGVYGFLQRAFATAGDRIIAFQGRDHSRSAAVILSVVLIGREIVMRPFRILRYGPSIFRSPFEYPVAVGVGWVFDAISLVAVPFVVADRNFCRKFFPM